MNAICLNTHLKLSSNVVVQDLDDELVMLDLGSEVYLVSTRSAREPGGSSRQKGGSATCSRNCRPNTTWHGGVWPRTLSRLRNVFSPRDW